MGALGAWLGTGSRICLNWRVWISVVTAILVSVVAARLVYLDKPLRAGMGFISHGLCSGVFVSGLNPDQVYAQTLKPFEGISGLEWAIRYEISRTRLETKASLGGAYERLAVFAQGRGCTLLSSDEPASRPLPERPPAGERVSSPVLPEIAGPAVVEPTDKSLRAALDRSFAEPDKPPYVQTAAVVVVHDGRVVAERYAPGYGVDTQIHGWSAAKSITSALVGILVRQGRLSVDGPAPVEQWRDPADPRHAITIDMLLRMTSGLDLPETNREYDAVNRMMMIESDMASFAEHAGLASPPGKTWKYTTGNTMVLSRIIRDAVGGHASDVLAFARRELFEPLGMRNVTLEFDATGTPMGYLFASARDWARFGMLYLQDGVVGGRRILPEGWVRYSSSQTLDSSYAAGFWRGSSGLRARWGIPEDAFFASGLLGQRVMVIPSERLVIARFGNAHGPGYDIQGFVRLVAEVRQTLATPR